MNRLRGIAASIALAAMALSVVESALAGACASSGETSDAVHAAHAQAMRGADVARAHDHAAATSTAGSDDAEAGADPRPATSCPMAGPVGACGTGAAVHAPTTLLAVRPFERAVVPPPALAMPSSAIGVDLFHPPRA